MDDISLQRYGKNLGGAEPSAAEVAAAYAKAEELKERFTSTMGKMAEVGETELPASRALVADVQHVASKASRATTADDWRAVANEAAALPNTYRREHDTDIARLEGERAPAHIEKRADVGYAQQDN